MTFWHGRKAAVTGATGFIGHHAALALRREGTAVVALVRPTSDVRRLVAAGVECVVAPLEDFEGLVRGLRGCDCVVHAAGAVGFGGDARTIHRTNVGGTENLLAAARRAGVLRVVHTSSIVAVGASRRPAVLDETADWNLGRIRVPYIDSKRRAEAAALAADGGGLEVVVVNPASVVGPDDFGLSEFGVLCRRFWRRRIPFHFGGGNNFVDVRDVAGGLLQAAERGRPGQRYLLAGEDRTYGAFFTDLCRAAQRTIPRVRLPNAVAGWVGRLNDRLHRSASKRPCFTSAQAAVMGLFFFFDSGKARREIGFSPRPLRESLADAHAYWTSPAARQAAADIAAAAACRAAHTRQGLAPCNQPPSSGPANGSA